MMSPYAPRAGPAREQALRQTFLWRIPDPDDSAALVRTLGFVQDLMLEAGFWGPDPERDEPLTVSELRAVFFDLGSLVAYLRELAGERFASTFPEPEAVLRERCVPWSAKLEALAFEIAEGIGELPPPVVAS
ncbi:MAG TPA: hypothetical protein VF017_22960 [Thermoanaerobaculia bacterium]|nr:hypothetical protein [Thermoanaerobaculia bacterium]